MIIVYVSVNACKCIQNAGAIPKVAQRLKKKKAFSSDVSDQDSLNSEEPKYFQNGSFVFIGPLELITLITWVLKSIYCKTGKKRGYALCK